MNIMLYKHQIYNIIYNLISEIVETDLQVKTGIIKMAQLYIFAVGTTFHFIVQSGMADFVDQR